LLRERDGLKVRVVSAPSEGLFRNQSAEYQDHVLPAGVPRFGMTAGLSVTLAGLVGDKGRIWGMDSFGYSAPFKVLDEKLGFNGENVWKEVKKLL
jgi:transketolase